MIEGAREHSLFVYGALLDPVERARLLGRPIEARPARLPGHQRRRSRYFYVVRCDGAEVVGVILAGLSEEELGLLDRYEEVPELYTRERINVLNAIGATVECWIYLPTAWTK